MLSSSRALVLHGSCSTSRLGGSCRRLAPQPGITPPCVVAARTLVTSRATGDNKSWADISAEIAAVGKDVVSKIKDTATSALESLTKPKAPEKRQQQQQQRSAPLYRPEDDGRQLPQFPGGAGGLLGGMLGGLVNQAVKGLASQLEKAAAESRGVSEEAARRIQASARVRQRLGPVTVGPPMSQSVSSQNINGRVMKSVSLVLPLYAAAGGRGGGGSGGGGLPLAQAQVVHSEGSGQQQRSRIQVRMPEGDVVVVDDDEPFSSSSSSNRFDADGEVVEAEFKDLK